jgi:hypothetical protein
MLHPGENGLLLGNPDGDLGFNSRRIISSPDEPSNLSTDKDGFIFYAVGNDSADALSTFIEIIR